jgi:hypothetical protein
MLRANRRGKRLAAFLLFLFAATFGVGAACQAQENPTPAQMMEQIRQLQAKVDKLEAAQAAEHARKGPATAPSATTTASADTNSTVQSVERDAEHRTTPTLDESAIPFTAGWDGKQFVIRSEDGAFTFHPGFVLDIRNVTTYRQDIAKKGGGETGSTGDDIQNGFELTRARFLMDGVLFKNIGYFVQFSADQGTPLTLLDAYGTYRFDQSPFTFKVGQFKDPLWHERNLSEARLMAVDRSLVETFLGGGQGSRLQGAALIYDQSHLRTQLVIHDGFNSQNTKFLDAGGVPAGVAGAAGVTPTDFGFSGRADLLVIGKRDADHHPFTEYDGGFTSLNFKQTTLIIGGGADFTQAGSNDVLLHTVDAQFNIPGGLSLYAAYLGAYRALHTNQGVAPGYYYDPGFLVQAGYLIAKRFEPFARYDYTHLDPSSVTTSGLASHVVQEITIGANYYVYQQNVKLTIDASYLPDGSPVDADALGVLKNSGENEFILRGQVQLAI